jgi:hypothetical protein
MDIDVNRVDRVQHVLEKMGYIALREWHWNTETRRYLDYLVDIGCATRNPIETVKESFQTIKIIRYEYKFNET